MPLLSFSVFKEKLLSGEKTQTVREIRIHPIKVGDILQCWWKSCDPKRKQKLFDARCTDVTQIQILYFSERIVLGGKILSPEEKEEFAIADGFNSSKELFEFFRKTYKKVSVLNFNGILIKWERI